MSTAAVSSAANWIGKLLVEEVKYLSKVSGSVEELQSELEWMQCFLLDADQKRHSQAVVQKWVSQIKDHAFEAEDLIEKYILKVSDHSRHQIVRLFSWKIFLRYLCIIRDGKNLHAIGSEIDALTYKISKLSQKMQTYGVEIKKNSIEDQELAAPELLRTYSYIDQEDYIIGLDHDTEMVVNYLALNSTNSKEVVAVCGMGGLGKTTLARKVYHDGTVKTHFNAFAWAHVSQKFNTKSVLESIMWALIPKNDEEMKDMCKHFMDAGEVHRAVHQVMQQMKCLVVVDDVWTSEDFNRLRAAFPIENDATDSRVLLTTRNKEVIQGLDSLFYLHQPHGLDENDAWKLFLRKAFPNTHTCPADEFERLGKDMLQHCGGVPLAIAALGGVLKTKTTVADWKAICNNIGFYLRKGKVPNQPYRSVYDVLKMSYDNLPPHLKPCFLHLATFPEDFQIQTEKLFQVWMADGIVTNSTIDGEEYLEEDTAPGVCLNELAAKSMVQVLQRSPVGDIETCLLHDLMRDVCISMAKEEGFLQIVTQVPNKTCDRKSNSSLATNTRLRRLVVYVDQSDQSSSTKKSSSSPTLLVRAPYLRSLLFFSIGENHLEEDCTTLIKNICNDYPLLRVLEFDNYHIKGSLPKQVGSMIHLRYLGLGTTRISRIPTSVGNLKCLQTLDLRVKMVPSANVISLPNVLWMMRLLKHLYLPHFEGLGLAGSSGANTKRYEIRGAGKLRLDGLRYLETISNLNLETVDVKGLNDLENIKTLVAACVVEKETLEPFLGAQSMKKMCLRIHPRIVNEHPTVLSNCGSLDGLDIHSVAYKSFPLKPLHQNMFHDSLAKLAFWYCNVQVDPMPTLEKLPNLTSLSLHLCYNGNKITCTTGGFPKLSYVALDGLFSLRKWEAEEGSLTCLENLEIYNCPISILPEVFPASVSITCNPCIPGIEKYGSCPHSANNAK